MWGPERKLKCWLLTDFDAQEKEAGRKTAYHLPSPSLRPESPLAAATGRHWTFISRIERGMSLPNVLVLFEVAEALKLPPSQMTMTERTLKS